MPRVLLIRPLCEGEEPELAEPLGIERLAGYLLAHGIEDVALFDRRLYQREKRLGLSGHTFWGDVRQWFADGAPDVVGLSIMTAADVPDALRIISRARSLWPRARLEAGGLYVTTAPDEAARRLPSVVTLMGGEGEQAFLRFVMGPSAAVSGHLSPDDWAMAYRPFVDRYAALGCAVNMQTSRGCPGRCTFCATPQLPEDLRRWRPRSLRLVVDEMEHEAARLEVAGQLPVFNFVDDDFGPLERIEALVDELENRQLRAAFALEMRLASLIGQPRLTQRLRRLHEAGLARVFVGVESLNPQTLRRWRKPYDVTALPEVLGAFSEAGVSVRPGYILWHKDQTVEGARNEVEKLWQLGIYSHRAVLSRLIVFPGCALAEEDSTIEGYQRMAEEAESFYQRFLDASADLANEWIAAAMIEPRVAAEALLTGDNTQLIEVTNALAAVNARSYELFGQVAP